MVMSGVIGASFRSSVGSPACTATVSECGIASAYLTLVVANLGSIAQPLEHRQPSVEVLAIAGQERQLTAHPRRIRHGSHLLPKCKRLRQHRTIAPEQPQSSAGLRLQWAPGSSPG